MIAPIPEADAAQRACPLIQHNPCKGRECAWWRFVHNVQLPEPHTELTIEPEDGADFPAEQLGLCLGIPSQVNNVVLAPPPQGIVRGRG